MATISNASFPKITWDFHQTASHLVEHLVTIICPKTTTPGVAQVARYNTAALGAHVGVGLIVAGVALALFAKLATALFVGATGYFLYQTFMPMAQDFAQNCPKPTGWHSVHREIRLVREQSKPFPLTLYYLSFPESETGFGYFFEYAKSSFLGAKNGLQSFMR